MENLLDQAKACHECGICMEVCPTYEVTGDELKSPMGRMQTAAKVFEDEEISAPMMEGIYSCLKCVKCEDVCPQEISVTKIVHNARETLARKGLGPLPEHNKVIEGIFKNGNSVGGAPQKRLDWLPEDFPKHESDTLLYMGCLPAYVVKDAARATYLVLKKLGFDFMLLEDDGCCGTYLYDSGRTDLAAEYFQKNVEKFASLGIKKIVVPCNGCFKCFKYYYPDILGKMDFSVSHAVTVIHDLLKENPNVLKKVQRTLTYQDPCRLARGEGLTEEPREVLELCGAQLEEVLKNRKTASCCGAGAGVRSIYRDLSMKVALNLLNTVETESLITSCPFCTFNLSFASKKNDLGKQVTYFSKIVLDSLE